MSIAAEIVWFIGFVVFDLIVWAGAWYFFSKVVRKGPDMDTDIIDGAQHHEMNLGELPSEATPEGRPLFVRPTA